MSPASATAGTGAAIASVADLLARAHAMEVEAAERDEDFAARMELHNNREVAALFRKLAGIERKHAESLAAELESRGVSPPPHRALAAAGEEGLETGSGEALHYLMTPYHALEIALQNERRALGFFALLTKEAAVPELRRAAEEFAREEAEHVALLQKWLSRTAKPSEDWAYDPDEPRMPD